MCSYAVDCRKLLDVLDGSGEDYELILDRP